MTTEVDTTQVEIRDNAYETREFPSFGWDWPDEAQLADFAEQDVRAEKDDRVEQAAEPLEDDPEYATLYFVA